LKKKQNISAALSQQSAHYDSLLKAATGEVFEKLSDILGQQNESVQAAIQQYQQTGIDSAEALLQQLLNANRFRWKPAPRMPASNSRRESGTSGWLNGWKVSCRPSSK
jgi:thioesterase domain-containing protein